MLGFDSRDQIPVVEQIINLLDIVGTANMLPTQRRSGRLPTDLQIVFDSFNDVRELTQLQKQGLSHEIHLAGSTGAMVQGQSVAESPADSPTKRPANETQQTFEERALLNQLPHYLQKG